MDVENEKFEIYDARLHLPFTMLVVGASSSGKTYFTVNLLKNTTRLMNDNVDYIVWCYGQATEQLLVLKDYFKDKIKLVEGVPDNFDDYIIQGKNGIIVCDDSQSKAVKSQSVVDMFTKKSHHTSTSFILILQDAFSGNETRKTIFRNTHYLVLFRTPLDNSVVFALGQKIFPYKSKLFSKIYNAATTREKYSYLFIDGTVHSHEHLRFRTSILHPYYQTVFLPITE